MSYEEIIAALFARKASSISRESLEVSQMFAEKLGNPHRNYPTIHIAGTNGKGSVALKIAKAYEALGKKVGLYTSPHIFSYEERITINGVEIPKERVVQGLLPLLALDSKAPFFELTTHLAFQYFSEENVDIAIIETGIGGLYDTTNIITPLVSIITSIGKDHVSLLGSTLEEIAFHKAGIIKPGVPVVVGPKANFSIMHQRVDTLHLVSEVPGFYDRENSAIAQKALEILGVPQAAIQAALPYRPSCRFQQKGGVIFDVAHNPAGFERLLEALEIHFPGRSFAAVVGMSKEKDVEVCLGLLAKRAVHIYLMEASHARAVPTGEMAAILKKKGYFSFTEGIEILPPQDLLVVCGTFFIMEEAHRRLLGHKIGIK